MRQHADGPKHVNRCERLAAWVILARAVTEQGGVVMAFDPARVAELIDRLANRLQAIVLLVQRLEPDLKQSARDAADLLNAASQATGAIEEFRSRPDGE